MSKQFDLEQSIMGCWNIIEDLKTLQRVVMDKRISDDDTANILIGIEKLYQLKFEQCFETFEDFLKEYYTIKKGGE
jgi:hypothetical protein